MILLKNNIIDLTKNNIANLECENVIAITIAEGGAMGEPNAFHVVTKSLEHYYTTEILTSYSTKDNGCSTQHQLQSSLFL